MDRSRKIIQTSIIGIAVNIVLVVFKMIVGVLANSIAIILDAVNNLSDALSSFITIIGTKLAGRRPDKKHPYGYGRIEYLTAVVIAVIVLMAGVTSLKESAGKVFHPDETSYTVLSLVVIIVGVLTKLFIGTYVKKKGEELHSDSLVASGSDAFFDAVLSAGTFVTAVLAMVWKLQLEGILGVIISLIILKAGVEMLLETLNSIIGTRSDPELSTAIKDKVTSYPGVRGAYDLTLHNYGPTQIIGSVHIEVSDSMTARELHGLTRRIAGEIYAEYGIILTVGIYAGNDSDPELAKVKEDLQEVLSKHPEVLQMHGFYVEKQINHVMFDLVVEFGADVDALRESIVSEMKKKHGEYEYDLVLDSDYSD